MDLNGLVEQCAGVLRHIDPGLTVRLKLHPQAARVRAERETVRRAVFDLVRLCRHRLMGGARLEMVTRPWQQDGETYGLLELSLEGLSEPEEVRREAREILEDLISAQSGSVEMARAGARDLRLRVALPAVQH